MDQRSGRRPWWYVAPGAILALVPFVIAQVKGQTEVWGDGLPWVVLFWFGVAVFCLGLFAVWLDSPRVK
jgi:hypothetical protein